MAGLLQYDVAADLVEAPSMLVSSQRLFTLFNLKAISVCIRIGKESKMKFDGKE